MYTMQGSIARELQLIHDQNKSDILELISNDIDDSN